MGISAGFAYPFPWVEPIFGARNLWGRMVSKGPVVAAQTLRGRARGCTLLQYQ